MVRFFLTLSLLFSVSATAQQSASLSNIETGVEFGTIHGDLTYTWGYILTVTDPNFGGISGFFAKPSDTTVNFTGVTDAGYHVNFAVSDESSVKVTNIILTPQFTEDDPNNKVKFDSEAIAEFKDDILITYEQNHRIFSVRDQHTLNVPSAFTGLENNGGVEAITALDDNHFIMFAEHPEERTWNRLAWIGTMITTGKVTYETRSVLLPEDYYPTDATTLENGDVLLLMRRFAVFRGASTKIMRITKNSIDSGKPLKGAVIANFDTENEFDNLEALAAVPTEEGHDLYLMSDDNFNPFQNTVLLKFFYPDPQ